MKRTDSNQTQLVKDLRSLGCSVLILSNVGKGCPDILIGLNGKNLLLEIKDGSKPPSKRKLTEHEAKFFNTWKGQVALVSSFDEALKLIGTVHVVSRCCKKEVNVAGSHDFDFDKHCCTHWYECSSCRRPCDPIPLDERSDDNE